MSGLAAVLAGRQAPGVYRWHSALAVPDVSAAVEQADWRFAHLDCWQQSGSKRAFLESVGVALAFPGYYGVNLDALHDCLHGLRASGRRGTLLLWDGWGPLARADRRAFAAAIEIFRERSAATKRDAFTVLLRGDGPETPDLHSLG
jgi:RNAse (barnase) inhibitor barstar